MSISGRHYIWSLDNYRLKLSSDSIILSFTHQVVLTTGEKKEVLRDRNVCRINICLSKCLAVERECLLLLAILGALVLLTWVARLALVVLSLKEELTWRTVEKWITEKDRELVRLKFNMADREQVAIVEVFCLFRVLY